eukprot:TRINITY_DN1938_c0_g1_i1.p1 TRINITY_DN1938_c0_g1~~TRINITY_DN1938_c0_g1_i1.p1  ORF type:complete len:295 (+),score=60.67 TRINITY_DN1938_c0_g1_i1:91-975(+)
MSKIGFLGLGLMGERMAFNLAKAPSTSVLNAWNRTLAKTEEFSRRNEHKIKVFPTVQECIRASEVIAIMLPDGPTVKKTLGDARAELRGKIIVQMSTIASAENIELSETVAEAGGSFIECPVLGSPYVAEAGNLALMIAGETSLVDKVVPLLAPMGTVKFRSDQIGKPSVLKLALNQMIASHMSAFSFSLSLLRKQGIPTDPFLEILRGSPAHSGYYDYKYDTMSSRNYENPTFSEKLFAKDVGLMVEEGKKSGLDTRGVEGILSLAQTAMDLGWGDKDMGSLQEAIMKNARKE